VISRGETSALRLAAWNGIAWLALAAYGFVSTSIVFRAGGEAGFGVWATISALRTILTFIDGGLAMGVTRDVVLSDRGDPSARSRIASAATIYVAFGVLVGAAGLLGSTVPGSLLALEPDAMRTAQALTALLGIEAGFAIALSPVTAALRGRQRFDVLAAGAVVQTLVGTALLITLVGRFGLVGAGLAVLVARAIGALVYIWPLWAFRVTALRWPSYGDIRQIARFALPLWVSAAAAAAGLSVDVPLVGGIYGAAMAGAFGVGAAAPAVAVGAVWVLIDTLFPRLVALGGSTLNPLLRSLVLVGSLFAGLGFGAMILHAGTILRLWVGEAPALAEDVMRLYAVAWAANIPAHVLSLGAIAHGRHGMLIPIVIVEAAGNLFISVVLILTVGPVGPAIGTLVTIALSNLVVVPLILGSKLSLGVRSVLGSAAVGFGLGSAFALLAWLIARDVSNELIRLALGVGIPAAAGGGVVHLFRTTRFIQRLPGVLFLGGWRVLLSERRERRESLTTRQLAAPEIWLPDRKPLVTVRIATYNRGRLVAERALASVSRQTYKNLEILVVGDACDAITENAVRSFPDRRIRFHNLARRGVYPADPSYRWMVAGASPMNWALENLAGEWIAPLDDDDEFTEDHIEVLLEACMERRAEFAYGIAEVEGVDGTWGRVGSWPLEHGQIVHASVFYGTHLRNFKHSFDSWRIEEPGDWNLWKRMRNAGVSMTFIDRVVCRHYVEHRDVSSDIELTVSRLSQQGI
jgi:O-antigen/teichoic acid export membrane protein